MEQVSRTVVWHGDGPPSAEEWIEIADAYDGPTEHLQLVNEFLSPIYRVEVVCPVEDGEQ